jgi:hypothetical protein
LNNATDRKTELLDIKLKESINEFLDFRNKKDSMADLKKEKEELNVALKLRKILNQGDAGFLKSVENSTLKSFGNELQTIIEANTKKITSAEYLKHLYELAESYYRDYDIKNLKIENEGKIAFMVDDDLSLNGAGYEYHWKAKIIKKAMLRDAKA